MPYQFEFPFVFEPPIEHIHWSEEDIDKLRVYVLKQTISSLTDGRSCLKTRTQALDWLMDDSVSPFSYPVCCYAEGVNPDSFRDIIVHQLNRRDNKGH